MNKQLLSLLFLFFLFTNVFSQAKSTSNLYIEGTVIDKQTREPLSFMNVIIWKTTDGTTTDDKGYFRIGDLTPGVYRVQVSGIGYTTWVSPEFMLVNHGERLTVELEENVAQLNQVEVTVSPFRKTAESPLSNKKIGFKEIEQSPGANRDIARVVQSFPGVASTPSGYRNDLIVRGGGPSENRYFLDGIEVPNINHFATQGASGGPVSIINADLVRDIDFYLGAFPSNRGNALSSVMNISLKDGDATHQNQSFVVGSSEIGLTLDGHIGDKVTYQFSARQSYLQLLFKALGLPFLPNFIDSQFKVKYKIDKKNEITFLGLLGIDDMTLNKDTAGFSDDKKYLWSILPRVKQNTYTIGANYKHYAGKHVQTYVLSRNSFNNKNIKHIDNDKALPMLINYRSTEAENKLRFENTSSLGQFKLTEGLSYEFAEYFNSTNQFVIENGLPVPVDYSSRLHINKYGLFVSGSFLSLDERMTISLGVRTDWNDYNKYMKEWYKQLSPRLAFSYKLLENLSFNSSIGRYYQLPSYTVMGYKNQDGLMVNKDNLKMLYNDQVVAGFEYLPNQSLQLSVEGFYKKYGNSLISLIDSIPLFSKGNDYGVFGNEPVMSNGKGRSYGVEVFGRWFGYKRLNMMASYTWVRSENYSPKLDRYVASTWDNRHLFTFTGSVDLPKNWKIGTRFRLIGGAPYTPFDMEESSLKINWDATQRPVLNYAEYNSKRLKTFNQLDLRIDKFFFFRKLMFGVYVDLQNALNTKYRDPDALLSTGIIENPDAPLDQQRYRMKTIRQESGTIVPTLGISLRL